VLANQAGGLSGRRPFSVFFDVFLFFLLMRAKGYDRVYAHCPERKYKPTRPFARRALSLSFGFPFFRQADWQTVSRLFIQEPS
jgi:hypothetical protein